jgi:GTP-binding protein
MTLVLKKTLPSKQRLDFILQKDQLSTQSAWDISSLPLLRSDQGHILPEIPLVGRSNVGKSSLINHLLRTSLAKTSSVPGKTDRFYFYILPNFGALVDLPGFGFARRSKDEQKRWAENIETYLHTRKNFSCILFLLDIRRSPDETDLSFIQWMLERNQSFALIFTKTDKVSSSQIKNRIEKAKMFLQCEPPIFSYSIKNDHSRYPLQKFLDNTLSK